MYVHPGCLQMASFSVPVQSCLRLWKGSLSKCSWVHWTWVTLNRCSGPTYHALQRSLLILYQNVTVRLYIQHTHRARTVYAVQRISLDIILFGYSLENRKAYIIRTILSHLITMHTVAKEAHYFPILHYKTAKLEASLFPIIYHINFGGRATQ